MTVTPVSTAQHCIPLPLNPEIPSDVHVNMEEKDEGWMNPELTELKSSSAGTGLNTPGQQCHPIWETGRTTADGFLTAGVGSNLGKHTSPTTERVDTRAVRTTTTSAASHITFLQRGSEENKVLPGGKEEKPPPWNAAVILSFLFLGGALGHRRPAACTSCFFLSLCACLSALFFIHCFVQVTTFHRADVRNQRARIFLPTNPLKIITTVSGSAVSKCLGN